jgi:hypothetical protein
VSPAHANRLAISVVVVAVIALALVLGLWQRVDAACEGVDFDPADPVTTCQPPAEVEQPPVSAEQTAATSPRA